MLSICMLLDSPSLSTPPPWPHTPVVHSDLSAHGVVSREISPGIKGGFYSVRDRKLTESTLKGFCDIVSVFLALYFIIIFIAIDCIMYEYFNTKHYRSYGIFMRVLYYTHFFLKSTTVNELNSVSFGKPDFQQVTHICSHTHMCSHIHTHACAHIHIVIVLSQCSLHMI